MVCFPTPLWGRPIRSLAYSHCPQCRISLSFKTSAELSVCVSVMSVATSRQRLPREGGAAAGGRKIAMGEKNEGGNREGRDQLYVNKI